MFLLWILNCFALCYCIITLNGGEEGKVVSLEKVKALYEYGHRQRVNLDFRQITKHEFMQVFEWLWTNLTQEQLYQLQARTFSDGSRLEDLVEKEQWYGFLQESWEYDPVIYHYLNMVDLSLMTKEQFEEYGQGIYNLTMEATCGLFKKVVMSNSHKVLKKQSLLPVSDWFLLSLSPIKLYECRLAGLLPYVTEEHKFLQLLGFMVDTSNDPTPRIMELFQSVREAWQGKHKISYVLANDLINEPVSLKTGYLKYRLQQFGQGMVNVLDGKCSFEWNLSLLAKDELSNILQSEQEILKISDIKIGDKDQKALEISEPRVQQTLAQSNEKTTDHQIVPISSREHLLKKHENSKLFGSHNFIRIVHSFLMKLSKRPTFKAALFILLSSLFTVYFRSPPRMPLLDNMEL